MKKFGEGMTKEHWVFSPYTVWLNPQDKPRCLTVAYDVPYEPAMYKRLSTMAEQNYKYKLMIDDLPSATVYHKLANTTNSVSQSTDTQYDYGILVAQKVSEATGAMTDEISVMNHLVLNVDTHSTSSGAIRIVGFKVEAFSVDWGENPCQKGVE